MQPLSDYRQLRVRRRERPAVPARERRRVSVVREWRQLLPHARAAVCRAGRCGPRRRRLRRLCVSHELGLRRHPRLGAAAILGHAWQARHARGRRPPQHCRAAHLGVPARDIWRGAHPHEGAQGCERAGYKGGGRGVEHKLPGAKRVLDGAGKPAAHYLLQWQRAVREIVNQLKTCIARGNHTTTGATQISPCDVRSLKHFSSHYS